MFAAMSEHTEVLSLLLNAGAKHFDGEADDGSVNHGWSPLHYAVMHNSLGTVQLLLEANANANAADAQVRTDAAHPKRALAPTAAHHCAAHSHDRLNSQRGSCLVAGSGRRWW